MLLFVPLLNIQGAVHVANRTFTDALPGGFDTTSVLPRCRVENHGRKTAKKTKDFFFPKPGDEHIESLWKREAQLGWWLNEPFVHPIQSRPISFYAASLARPLQLEASYWWEEQHQMLIFNLLQCFTKLLLEPAGSKAVLYPKTPFSVLLCSTLKMPSSSAAATTLIYLAAARPAVASCIFSLSPCAVFNSVVLLSSNKLD